MAGVKETVHNEAWLKKEELRAGYVLTDTVIGLTGSRSGHVLTPSDVEKIQASGMSELIRVFIKTRKEVSKTVESDTSTFSPVNNLSQRDVFGSLIDSGLSTQLEGITNHKIRKIRGENYNEVRESYVQKHENTFDPSVINFCNYSTQDRDEIIHHYATSQADMDALDRIEAKDTKEINRKLKEYEHGVHAFLRAIMEDKHVHTSYIHHIVVDFISDVGYKLAKALFSAIICNTSFSNFLVSHSLQTMIVSLVTAIELTHIINEKANSLDSENFKNFMSINKKSFTIDELTNVAIAAILHDIDYLKTIPGLHAKYEFSMQEDSLRELHPSNGFHLVKNLNLDYEVQSAILQHHERCDGSGIPKGLQPRFFSKYTPILMFAEHYIEMTTPNPFEPTYYSPRKVLVDLLTVHKGKFDADVVYAFLKAASLFPIGSWVVLSDKHIGVVKDLNKEALSSPIVDVHFDPGFQRISPVKVDLSVSDLSIDKPVHFSIINHVSGGNIDFIYE